jgi:hypothetical protein
MFNTNDKLKLIKKHLATQRKQIWTHCFSVATYYVVSYHRFLYTDPVVCM